MKDVYSSLPICCRTQGLIIFALGHFGTLSQPSVSSDCVFFLASDLEPCLVMGAMSEGFSVDSAAPPGWACPQ